MAIVGLMVVFEKSNIFEPNDWFFQKFESSLKRQRTKGKFSDSPCQNILKLDNVLLKVLDTQYSKLSIRATSRVAKQLKTRLSEIKKYQENPKFGCRQSLVIGLSSRNQSLATVVKKARKKKYQPFLALSNFTGFLYFVPNFCPGFYFLKICNYKTFVIYTQIFP